MIAVVSVFFLFSGRDFSEVAFLFFSGFGFSETSSRFFFGDGFSGTSVSVSAPEVQPEINARLDPYPLRLNSAVSIRSRVSQICCSLK